MEVVASRSNLGKKLEVHEGRASELALLILAELLDRKVPTFFSSSADRLSRVA